jgi:hypothetical protein
LTPASPSATSNDATASPSATPWAPRPAPRPLVQPLAPGRYRVQFTIGRETHDRLRRVQTLLRREIPNGDPAAIFDRALELLEKVAKAKIGLTARRRSTPKAAGDIRAYETRIRFETDKPPSRHIPNAVKRAVWRRDEGRCAFVATTGRRCGERNFLEFHHVQPYALEGPATVGNISLRCRRHNAYEAELIFGPRGPSIAGESRGSYPGGPSAPSRQSYRRGTGMS